MSSQFVSNVRQKYQGIVNSCCEESQNNAIMEEIASTEEVMEGIEVLTDARHGTRKNAKDTDVICLGGVSHKCLWNGHLTRKVDPVTQRHELLGVKKMYEHFYNYFNTLK